MPNPFRRLTIWAVLCILAAVLLYGFCWLDTTFAADGHLGIGPRPYAATDTVRFGLGGLRYFSEGELLSGPHIGYPLVLAALALNTLVLWMLRGWNAVRARRMWRVSLAALLLTLGLGLPVLKVAEAKQNALLRQPTVGISEVVTQVSAGPVWLKAARCSHWQEGCQSWSNSQWPNPTAWGIAGLFMTGLVGLRRIAPGLKNPAPAAHSPGS